MHACIKKSGEEGGREGKRIREKGGKEKILVSNWSKKNSKKTKKIQYKQFLESIRD